MKIRKVLATSVLTTAALIQAAMPAFAAKQTNGSPVDQPAAHTQFGIVESDKDVSGQVSFEVPLYVTMAAVSNKGKMAVPSKDAYYIENTSKSIMKQDDNGNMVEEPTEPIGVTSIEVKGLDGGWSIVGAADTSWATAKELKKDTTGEAHKMTFTLGKEKFGAMAATGEQTIYNNDKTSDKYWAATTRTDSTQFVEYSAAEIDIDANHTKGHHKLISIGKGANKMKISMDADIAKISDRGEKATTGVFKVVYTLAALDDYGQPRNAAVYAGDNWKDAGYTEDQNK